jgi:hypothetical protein
VIGMNLAYEDPGENVPFLGQDGQPLDGSSPEALAWVDKTTADSVAALGADGRKVVIIEPIPVAPPKMNPLSCLSKADVVQQCRYVAKAGPDALEQYYRQVGEQHDNVWSADIDKLVCPYLPICDPIVDGQIVKFDGSHITARYATAIAPAIDAYFRNDAILD